MGKCSACRYGHSHPGEKSCRFTKDAKEKCKQSGTEETRWREFLDVDTLNELTKSDDPTGTGSFVSLDDFNALKQQGHDRKAQMDKLEDEITNLSNQMTNLLSIFPGPVGAPAVPSVATTTGAWVGVTTSSVVTATPVITPVTTATTTSVSTIVTGGSVTTSPPTLTVPSAFVPSTSHWRPPPIATPAIPSVWSVGTSHHRPPPMSMGATFPPSAYPPSSIPYGPHPHGSSAGLVSPTAGMIPAAYLSAPLTPALHSVFDQDPRQPGMMYRPEYHVLHMEEGEPVKQISHKLMTYPKLIHGMVLVARYIRANGGDIDKYLAHMDYVTRHGKTEDYQDSAYIEYDKMIIDDFVRNPSTGINVGNVMASSFCK